MTALKTSEIDAFVARPDPARSVVLIYGPDAGLVGERAQAIVRASVDNIDDPFSLVRLEGDDLSANPLRLVEEANTIPLFGGRRA
ncbi:MAG: DNA polymerase III subunit delta, partial [Pseudorhodoplanes sp.]|nr:DNA polymerase III subunit delta [Pseudorhodoplanes sp.]